MPDQTSSTAIGRRRRPVEQTGTGSVRTADAPEGRSVAASALRRLAVSDLGLAVVSGLTALLVAAAKLRLWTADLQAPMSPGGDTLLGLSVMRNMQYTGWFQDSPQLGYPFGQDLTAYPSAVGDTWHMLALRVLVMVFSPALSLNLYFLAGFFLAAFVAHLCLRRLGLPSLLAWVLSVLYALAPYHFLRGEPHLFLAAYFGVPLTVLLALRVLEGKVRLRWSPSQDRRLWLALAVCVLAAGLGLYYAVFTVLLVSAAGVLHALSLRRWWPAVTAGVLSGVVLVLLALAAVPNLLHQRGAGSIPISDRGYVQSEIYGLKIVHLLLPVRGHRVDLLARLRERVVGSPVPGEGMDTLGIVAAVGFVLVVVACLLPAVQKGTLASRLRPLGILTTICLLTGTVAGVAALASAAGFTQLRAWNRISIVISFLALAGLGLALAEVTRWWRRRQPGILRHAATAAVVLVLPLGLADEIAPGFTPDHAGITAAWDSDRAYFTGLEQRYGTGSQVFQLPYVPFPEHPPVVKMGDYEHLRGYVHSDLQWSYGAVKDDGRDWQPQVLSAGLLTALPRLAALGYDAVYVNRQGYADNGTAVEAQIRAATGDSAPLVNSVDALATYDLRPLQARLAPVTPAVRTLITRPVQADFRTGFHAEEGSEAGRWRWAAGVAELVLVNPLDRVRQVRLQGHLDVAVPGSRVTVSGPGSLRRDVVVPATGVPLVLDLALPPGETALQLTTDSGPPAQADPRDLRQRFSSYAVTDLEVAAATTPQRP